VSIFDEDGAALLKGGLTLSGIDKLKAEMFERNQRSPEQVYGQSFPDEAWRLVLDELRRIRSGKSMDSKAREDIDICMATAATMEGGMSPWDALCHQAGACVTAFGQTRPFAQMFLRESCYKVLNEEFVGRKVG